MPSLSRWQEFLAQLKCFFIVKDIKWTGRSGFGQCALLQWLFPSSPSLLSCNWHVTLCTTCWFAALVYCSLITTLALASTSSRSQNSDPFFWWEHLRFALRSFQVYNTVLLTRSQNFLIFLLEVWTYFGQHLSTSPLPLSPWEPPFCSLFLSSPILESVCKWHQAVFVSLCFWLVHSHNVLAFHPCCPIARWGKFYCSVSPIITVAATV